MKTPEDVARRIIPWPLEEAPFGDIYQDVIQAVQNERLLVLELYQCLKPLAELCPDINEGDDRKTVALFAPGRGVQNVITYGQILDARKALRHFGK